MNEENKEAKRFSEWEDCDCNQCEHYWDSSCDGVAKNNRKPCNQFVATRSVVIPMQIESLQRKIKWMAFAGILIALSNILTIIGVCFR